MATQNRTRRSVVLNDVSTGTSHVIRLENAARVGMMVEWGEGITEGEVLFETADYAEYAGKWNPSIALTAPGDEEEAVTGAAVDIAGVVGRVSIPTEITGGTVKVIIYLK